MIRNVAQLLAVCCIAAGVWWWEPKAALVVVGIFVALASLGIANQKGGE